MIKIISKIKLNSLVLIVALAILIPNLCACNSKEKESENEDVDISMLAVKPDGYSEDAVETTVTTETTEATEVNESQNSIQIKVLDKAWSDFGNFSEGLCPVQDLSSGMWGYVDRTGEYVIDPQFYNAYPFYDGLAAVQNPSGYFGFINLSGQQAFQGEYTSIESRYKQWIDGQYMNIYGFKEGYALVKDKDTNEYVMIDSNGTVIKNIDRIFPDQVIRFGMNLIGSYDDGVLMDLQYNEISKKGVFMPNDEDLYPLNFNTIITSTTKNDDGTFTLTLQDGQDQIHNVTLNIAIENLNWDKGAFILTNEHLIVNRQVNGIQTAAIYDFNGNLLCDYLYNDITPIGDGYFIAENNAELEGVIDYSGKIHIPFDKHKFKFISQGSFKNFDLNTGKFRLLLENKDDTGTSKYEYFDTETASLVYDNSIFDLDWSGTTALNNYSYIYNGTRFYIYNRKEAADVGTGYSMTIYDNNEENIGSCYLAFSKNALINPGAFIREGIIPYWNEEGKSWNFCIIEGLN